MIKLEVKIRIPHNKEIHYRVLTNKAFYDKRLTPLAKILLMHLLGKHSDDYTPTVEQLAKQLNSSKDKINRAIACLKKYGYLTSTSIGGKKHGVQSWWVFELPDYLTNSTSANGKDLTNSKTTNSKYAILYKDIDCGGENTPPQSENKNEEKINSKSVLEMSEEELNEYLPF